jgi:capsular exopolysaccharide synthesis family protein
MKPTPFNKRYGLSQVQRKPVAHPEDIETNYAYLETQDSNSQKEAFSDYFKVLKRRRWYVILSAFLITPLVALNMISEEKIYSTSTRLLIEDDNPQILNIKEIMVPDKSLSFFQTEYQLIRTQENIEEVIDILQLDKETPPEKPTFIAKMKAGLAFPSEILSFLKDKMLNTVPLRSEDDEEPPLTPAEGHRRQAIAQFYQSLQVQPQQNTKLVDIRISGLDPQLVAQQANTLAEIYIRNNLEKKLEVNRKAQVWLTEQIEVLEKQSYDAELKLKKLREEKKFVSLETEEKRSAILTELDGMNTEYNKIHKERINIESLLNHIVSLNSKDDIEMVQSLDNITIEQLKQKLLTLKDEYVGLINKYENNHPFIIQKKLQIDEIKRNIEEELGKKVKSIKIEYNILRAKELALEKEINKKKGEAIRFDDDMTTYNTLKRDADSYRKLYSEVSQRLREIKLTQAQTTSNIKIVEKASVPLQPLPSGNTLKMTFSIMIGCSIGIGFAFIRDYFDSNLKDVDEVERYLQIPCLSIIPSVTPALDSGIGSSSYLWTRPESLSTGRKRRAWTSTLFRVAPSDRRGDRSLMHRHIGTLHKKGRTILEAYNLLRTRLQSSSPDIKTLLVTSAGPSEGKSNTAVYLGMAFARLGRKVLLVDADLRQPSLHGRFRVQNHAGLSDILAQGHEWQQVIQDTSLGYLQILPAGAGPHGYPSDVLSLTTMQQLVEHLRNTFDLVIFDAPPMLSLPDAEILAPAMDGILLVHSPGKCAKEDVLEATRVLQRAGAIILGVVINNVGQQQEKNFYGSSQSIV